MFPHRSAARWQDLVLTVHWLLEFHPSGQEQLLWDLAELLHQQVLPSSTSSLSVSPIYRRALTGRSGLVVQISPLDLSSLSLCLLMESTMARPLNLGQCGERLTEK